jgi:hypothetical protein
MKRRNEPKIEEVNDVLSTSSGKKYTRAEWRMSIGMMLNNEHLRGDVILLAISMERHLDSFLADYFCRVGRLLEFHEELLPMLGFSQKIELLRKLNFRKSIK